MLVKIAIIGANRQQVPLIKSAKELGYQTHAFAWQDGEAIGLETADFFYPISVSNKEEILCKCREIGVNAVASIGSDLAALTAAYVSEALGLPGNSYEAVRRATNKIETRRLFLEHGISQPRFAEIGDVVSFDKLAEMKYPLIIKPSDRSGSRGIKVIQSESEFFSAINEARDLSFERRAIAEEYVSGKSYSAECVSLNGTHRIIAVTERETDLVNGRPLEYCHTQPAIIPNSLNERLGRDIPKILNAIGIAQGVSSVEFIIGDTGELYYNEVAPYLCGDYIGTDLVPLSVGVDLTRAVLDIALLRECEISPTEAGVLAEVKFEYSKADGKRGRHTVTASPLKEFGGAPALRISARRQYYQDGGNTVALNSEYTAFWYALTLTGAERVHIPYYSASAFSRIAEESGVECVYYHIGEDFLPTDLSPAEGDAVLIINYHGLITDYVKELPWGNLIIDNSMAFFEPPIMREGVYNIYSARKFFAVADGAYLISPSICEKNKLTLERDVSYKRALTLLKSLEMGESAAYKDMQTAEQRLSSSRALMSALTEKMLSAVDYESERSKRQRNFERLHQLLGKYNSLSLKNISDGAPQLYPLLVNGDIRSHLISKKIFVPLMWRRTLTEEFSRLPEGRLSAGLLCLPISAEYSEEDMEYIARTVIAKLT